MFTGFRQIWDRAAIETRICLVFASLLGLCAIYGLRSHLRILKCVLSLGGPPIVPILGNAGFVYDEQVLYKMSHTAYEEYGPVFRIWLSLVPCVVLLEPRDVQLVLASTKNTGKIIFYKMLDNFLGKGLITSSVDTWMKHRKILQPAFHLQFLEKFAASFARCSHRLVERISPLGGRDIDVTSFVNDCVYEILNETVLGVKIRKEDPTSDCNDESPFRKGKVLVPYRLTRPWLLIDWIYGWTRTGRNEQKQRNDLAAACRRIVTERRAVVAQGGTTLRTSETLVDFMIRRRDNGDRMTDEEIVDECCTFMLAGQDSVGTATAMTLFHLANDRFWLDKCVREIDDIWETDHQESQHFQPSLDHLRSMKALEMCIKETLRLYPSVPLFARTLGEDVKIGERVLPAGCGVILMPYATHRLPHHFPDPHSFKPERFSPENSADRHPYAYVPFSAGPRNCIGNKFAMLEIKSIVASLLRNFVPSPVSGRDKIQPKFRLTVRVKGGVWLRIAPRSHQLSRLAAT